MQTPPNQCDHLPEQLVSKVATSWSFWRVKTPACWYLYAVQPDEALHLGAFNDPGSLAVQQLRFLETPKATVLLPLNSDEINLWLEHPQEHSPPRFSGQLGSAWSGYGIKVVDAIQVEVIYVADLRHEWMGVFSEPDAFAAIELHYDRRRNRCLIC
jgi:hypothetical protein